MDSYSTPKPMKRVGDLFEKYRTKFKAPQATVKKECIIIIKEVSGFDIKIEQIEYSVNTRTVSLQISSLLKSELSFHYPQIILLLNQKLGSDVAPKIIR